MMIACSNGWMREGVGTSCFLVGWPIVRHIDFRPRYRGAPACADDRGEEGTLTESRPRHPSQMGKSARVQNSASFR